jgi:NADP-dependent 3-hydroxy acid dehydrogenase YdfG
MGKTAVITGASRGIGHALAILLSSKGFNVVAVARDAEALATLAKETNSLTFAGSVSDEVFVEKVVAETVAKYGQIDILINNAGISGSGPVEELTLEDWNKVYSTNVTGTFLFTKHIVPVMKPKGGHIITVASDVAKRVFETGSLYCSSKYAQHAFTEAVRKEVRKYGIKVSTIYSGLVDSSFHAAPQGDESHDGWLTNDDMAKAIYGIIDTPKHVVIDELMIHPICQDY